MIVLGTIAIVLITIAIGVLIDRKHPLLPKPTELLPEPPPEPPTPPKPTYAAGEAPATAIRARASQLEKLRGQRCTACRAMMTPGPDDMVRYDERDLLVLHFTCSCGSKRSLYVEPV